MRWVTHLLAVLGNDGAVQNVKADIDRRMALYSVLEQLSVRLAPAEGPLLTAEAA